MKNNINKIILLVLRYYLGALFLMTGVMKVGFSAYSNAFRIQLTESNIPLVEFNMWFVPVLEIIIGIMLFIKVKVRWALLMIIPIMLVAIYVHLTVTNPGAFPEQPQFPIMPLMALGATIYLLYKKQ